MVYYEALEIAGHRETKATSIPERLAALRSERQTSATRVSQSNTATEHTIKATGIAEGKRQERERLKAVLNSPVCKGHEARALHLLATTDLDAEAVISELEIDGLEAKVATKRTTEASDNSLVEAMKARFAKWAHITKPARKRKPFAYVSPI